MAGGSSVLSKRDNGGDGSEHFFGTALAVEEINASGGVLGKPIAPVAMIPEETMLPTGIWHAAC